MIISSTIHNEDVALYRIMPLERFLQMLTSQRNVLVKPFSWADPYESLIKQAEIVDKKGNKIPFDESFWYGQCWSESSGSDALWQVFTRSRIARAVKVKTSSTLLKGSLSDEEQKDDRVFFLERVKYPTPENEENELEALIRAYSYDWGYDESYGMLIHNDRFRSDFNVMAAPFLLTKRRAFQHEKEVRLLCYCKEQQRNGVLSYEIANWCNFIEEVELDPWTPNGIDVVLNDILLRYDMRRSDGSPLRATISDLYQKCKAKIVYSPQL